MWKYFQLFLSMQQWKGMKHNVSSALGAWAANRRVFGPSVQVLCSKNTFQIQQGFTEAVWESAVKCTTQFLSQLSEQSHSRLTTCIQNYPKEFAPHFAVNRPKTRGKNSSHLGCHGYKCFRITAKIVIFQWTLMSELPMYTWKRRLGKNSRISQMLR